MPFVHIRCKKTGGQFDKIDFMAQIYTNKHNDFELMYKAYKNKV